MKNWTRFLLCLLVSAGLWLIHYLSQTYSDVVSVQVVAESNIEGRARRSSSEVTVSARVEASGFRLFSLSSSSNRIRTVFFDASDFRHAGDDFYLMHGSALNKYSKELFGDGVNPLVFVTDRIQFKFARENCRKVPVKAVQNISYKSQYMPVGDIALTPDSVVVYGEPSRIDNIDAVLTRTISMSDVRKSMHGTVGLETPSGTRVSVEDVSYSIDVARYVELADRVSIDARNVPAGVKFTVIPGTAEVVFRCVFPIGSDPREKCSFYVDYRDYQKSLTGSCVIRSSGIPDGVIDCRIEPEVCECLVESIR